MAADGRPAAIIPGGGLPPPIAPQISQAPPDPRAAIRAAPSLPAPRAAEEYEPVDRPQPEPPAKPGMGPIEAQLTRDILNKDVDPRLKEAARGRIAAEQAQLAIPYANQEAKYKADIANWEKEQEQNRVYRQTRPKQAADIAQSQATTGKTQQELSDLQEKSVLQARFGGRDPDKAFTDFDKEKEAAAKTANAVTQYATVRDMLNKGIIVGTAQGLKVNAAKVASVFGYKSASDAVAHTEQLQAALTSTLGLAIDNIQGSGQKVSTATSRSPKAPPAAIRRCSWRPSSGSPSARRRSRAANSTTTRTSATTTSAGRAPSGVTSCRRRRPRRSRTSTPC